ncbi:MAG: hypothetical protein RSA17_09575 [Ruthenibacterium sp.]
MKCSQCGAEADKGRCPVCGAVLDDAPAGKKTAHRTQPAQPVLQQPAAQPYAGAAASGAAPKNRQPTWLVILLLVLFWPVGLFLMWRGTSWSRTVKILVTVAVSLVTILLLALAALGAGLVFSANLAQEYSVQEKTENAAVAHSISEMNQVALTMQQGLGDAGEGSTMRMRYDPDENSMVLDTTISGGAALAAYLLDNGATGSELDAWNGLKISYCNLSELLQDNLAENGYADVSSTVNLLNETNKSNMLLSIVNGEVLYNVVTDA